MKEQKIEPKRERKKEKGGEKERELIRRACNGDIKAFSELYAQIYIELYRFALFTLKQKEDAEDAVSETVIAAYENIHKLRKEESFRSWIFTILANQCKKKFGKRKNSLELNDEIHTEQLDERMSETYYEEIYDVREAFMKLGEEDRLIVSWSVLGGYLSEEIGAILNMKAATVRSRKARALEWLRKVLA